MKRKGGDELKFIEIGTYLLDDSKALIQIQLNSGFENASIKLNLFDYCLIYTLTHEKIGCNVLKIRTVNEKKGKIILEKINGDKIEGKLIDIKPYFPCEEVLENSWEQEQRYLLDFKGEVLGEYKIVNHLQALQFYSIENMKLLDKIKIGDHLRVLWWFHRFDKDSFRKNRMCQPPYEDAPKSGIFATRSPVRPNPLASTNVKVIGVDKKNNRIEVNGFDGFENSKILQIMFYQPQQDQLDNAKGPKWVAHWTGHKVFQEPKKIDVVGKNIRQTKKEENELNAEILFDELEQEDIMNSHDTNYDEITIQNAHVHNLRNISLAIPKKSITLISGVSGSGKSSLAFDTIYAESQKQFMDLILSNSIMDYDIHESMADKITGLQPAIAVEQKSLGSNPRSTVGTKTKIGEFIKLLFSVVGERLCPNCHTAVGEDNVCQACGTILFSISPQIFSYNHPDYMCPVCKGLGVEMQIDEKLLVEYPERSILDKASSWWGDLRAHQKKPNANWMRGEILALADDMNVDLEVPFNQLPEDFRKQMMYGSNGREVSLTYQTSKGRSGTITRPVEGAVNTIYRLKKDSKTSKTIENASKYMSKQICSRCNGERLSEIGRLVNIKGYRYPEVMNLSIEKLHQWCHYIFSKLNDLEREKCGPILSKIIYRLKRIKDVGLSYISLNRSIPSLSGGEVQRLKIATQFGYGLTDILYIMDEPSKGLHPKDYGFLMDTIKDLKRLNNTTIIVEHKKEFLSIADKHIEMGPKAGRYGGEIILEEEVDHTGLSYETDYKEYKASKDRLSTDIETIKINGVTTNNLKNVDAVIPIGSITAIIGVSGSGKSSLISKTLYPALMKNIGKSVEEQGAFQSIKGLDKVKDIIYVNQKPIGSNSRSNPGTYTGVFDLIRQYYAKSKEAKETKLTKEHFSFNSQKGQCPACKGLGQIPVEMDYMSNLFTICQYCDGKRYIEKVLQVKPNGYSINDVLEMEISKLTDVFKDEQSILDILQMLDKVGLSYLKLGQSATTLSGGEAQRIKLAKELYKKHLDSTLYILDEPTTGLHDDDVARLIAVLKELNNKGATIIIIEHNWQIIQSCHWMIELGPGGGEHGGKILQMGFLV